MKQHSTFKLAVGVLVLWSVVIGQWSVRADITATVYPGYQFSSTERPTADTLNLLGRPTIYISGTLGGTNVALAAESVSSVMLQSTLVDDISIKWNSSSPRELAIKAGGVGTNEINASIAGSGLRGGGGTNLSVAIDGSLLTVTNDVLTMNYATLTNIISVTITNSTPTTFTSMEYPLIAGQVVSTNHGWTNTPIFVRGVLVCKTNDAGYTAGSEVGLDGSFTHVSDTPVAPAFTTSVNTTNVSVVVGNGLDDDAIQLWNATNGAPASLNTNRWKIKIYARP